jgi:large subunit ribosomal protein L18
MAKKNRAQARRMRHRRVRAAVVGTPERPRLNVFRSLKHIYAQVVDDNQGHTLAAASTLDRELVPDLSGKSPVERAELVGKLVAKRAQEAGIRTVVFDRGGYRYHGRVKALAQGAREGGLEF